MRIGIVGSGVAVAGSAALAALAPSAIAVGQYDASASANSGSVTVAGKTVQPATASSNQDTGQKSASVPSSQVLPGLSKELQSALPGAKASFSGSTLLAVESDANGSGNSAACAAVLASGCQQGEASALKYTLGLGKLGSSIPGLGSVASDSLALTINGPNATCAAGPNGTGLKAATKTGTVTAALEDSSGQAIGEPVDLKSGNIFSQLNSISHLSSLTGALSSSKSPLTLAANQGTTQQGGGKASAKTGELGLSAGSTKILDIPGATVTCGPNTPVAGSTPPPTAPTGPAGPTAAATTPAATPTAPAGSSKPLSKIQTDEGRSSSSAPAWLALTGTP